MIWRTALALVLAACTGQSGESPFIACPTVRYEAVEPADEQLGYSAEQVVAALASPTSVTFAWAHDKAWIDRELALSITGFAIDGAVQIADYTQEPVSCELRGLRELVVPVSVSIDVGKGQGLATGSIELRATSAAPADIEVAGTWGPEVDLSGELGAALDTWWADVQARNEDWTGGFELDSVHTNLRGPWPTLELSIEALHHSDDYVSAAALWRGPAQFEGP